MNNNDKQIGWIINEEASDPELSKPKNIKKVGDHVEATCILQEAEETNRNGRFYAAEDLFPAVLPEYCKRTKELLEAGTLRAESGHPDSKELARQQKIEKKNCSAIFLSLWRDNNFLCAKYRGTNNELGKELEQDLLDGYLQSWSMRALGKVVNTQGRATVKNIKYITHDEVIYPSHPRAYTKDIKQSISESSSIEDIKFNDITYIKNDKGIIIPLANSEVINFIKESSNNLKTLKESFDVFYDKITLIENGRYVQLTDTTGNIFIIECEQFIRNEIMDYCNNLY